MTWWQNMARSIGGFLGASALRGASAVSFAGLVACASGAPPNDELTSTESLAAAADGSCTGVPSGSSTLPSGWLTADIGKFPGGSSLYDATTGSFVLSSTQKGIRRNGQGGNHCVSQAEAGGPYTGAPPDCTATDGVCQANQVCMPDHDGARFVYQQVTGDAEVVVRVACATGATGSQVGVMIRESSNMFSRMGALIVMRHMNNAGNSFACDIPPAQPSEFNELWGSNRVQYPAGSYPDHQFNNGGMPTRAMPGTMWLRLQRVGTGYVASRSRDGVTWTLVTSGEFTNPQAQIGFFVAGGETVTSSTAVIDHAIVRAPQLAYKSTWIGSSYVTQSTDFVSFGMHDFYVAPDGTSYKYSQAAEGGHSLNVINADGTLRKLLNGNSVYGYYQGGITGDGRRLFVGSRPFGSESNICTTPTTVSRLTFDLKPDGWSTTFNGVLAGLAAANGKLYASSVSITNRTVDGQPACPGVTPWNSRIRIIDPSGQTQETGFDFARPGPLAVQKGTDGIGRMWIVRGATDYPGLTQGIVSGQLQTVELSRHRTAPGATKPNEFDYRYTAEVLCYERINGQFVPCMNGVTQVRINASLLGYPAGTTFSPMGVTIDPGTDARNPADDRLLIADNGQRQRIVICTGLGGVGKQAQPSCTGSLGASGGVFAGPTPGLTADSAGVPRFFSPLAVGVDSAKNVYVASSAPRVDVRKFTPAGAPVWPAPVVGIGTEPGDFDPKPDGANQHYYTAARHFVFRTDRTTPGAEWEQKSIIWNPFDAYPSSARYEDTLYSGGAVWMRRFPAGPSAGLFMFRELDRNWEILRFVGEKAVPCGAVSLTADSRLRFWTDAGTLDGIEQPNEVTTTPVMPAAFFLASVDRDGNFWISLHTAVGGSTAIWKIIRNSSLANGVPTYNVASPVSYSLPQTELIGRRVRYEADQDALYVLGTKTSAETYAWLSGPWCDPKACPCFYDPQNPVPQSISFVVVERYNNWLSGGQTSAPAYRLTMPEQRANPTSDDDFDTRYADPACHCNDFHWTGFDVAGDLMFMQESHGPIRVFPNTAPGGQTPAELTRLSPGPELTWQGFWTDAQDIMRAVKRADEYLVTTLDSSNQARTITYRLPTTWTPASVSPLAWYVASDQDVTHANGVVSEWADHSGHGLTVWNAQPGGQPTYHLASWNGKPTVTFSGGQLLRRQGISGPPAGTDQPFTVLAVMRSTAVQDASVVAWWIPTRADAIRAALLPFGTETRPNLGRDSDPAKQDFSAPHNLGSTAPHVVAWRFTPNTMRITVDGTTYSSGSLNATGPLTFEYLLVGARSDLPTGMFRGDISELVLVPAYLSDGELVSFRTYAQLKWSLP
jgi:hypothetical protein